MPCRALLRPHVLTRKLCTFSRRIDENVLDAESNVEGAHMELLKYFQSVSTNRWLMIKIFIVLIVFFALFVVFLA